MDFTFDEPLSPQDRADMVVYLIEMIEHWNAGIDRQRTYEKVDQLAVEQFIDRRNSYVEQLAILLQHYGLEFRPTSTDGDSFLSNQRQAA